MINSESIEKAKNGAAETFFAALGAVLLVDSVKSGGDLIYGITSGASAGEIVTYARDTVTYLAGGAASLLCTSYFSPNTNEMQP